MIKAVIFDLDDTLYNYIEFHEGAVLASYEKANELFGVDKSRFLEAFEYGKTRAKIGMENVASGHNRILYYQLALEYLGINPIDYAIDLYEAYWGYILDRIELYPYVIPLFEELKNKGIKIGILSNLTTYIQHRKLRKLNISKYVDALVTSEEASVEKPDEKTFARILEKLEINPSEAVMVGDSLKNDKAGAEAVGILGIHFDGDEEKLVREINEACDNSSML